MCTYVYIQGSYVCVPSQVGTLTQVLTSVHLGRTTSTPIFLLTHLMPFSTQLGTQCFKIRLGMVGLLSGVNQIPERFSKSINSNKLFISCLVDLETTGNVIKNHMDRGDWGMPSTFRVNVLITHLFAADVSNMTNNRFNGNLHKILFTDSRKRQLT